MLKNFVFFSILLNVSILNAEIICKNSCSNRLITTQISGFYQIAIKWDDRGNRMGTVAGPEDCSRPDGQARFMAQCRTACAAIERDCGGSGGNSNKDPYVQSDPW